MHIQANDGTAQVGRAYSSWSSAKWPLVRRCNLPFATGRTSITLPVDGIDRRFVLYVPTTYDGASGTRMVVLNHGTGDNPEGFLRDTAFEAEAEARSFIVAAIEGYEKKWNTPYTPSRPDDVAFAAALLDWTADHLCVDTDEVFAAGFSGGARTASSFVCNLPGRFAGLAAVAGIRNDPPCATPATPVLAVHGTADTVNPYSGGTSARWGESVEQAVDDWRVNNGCGPTPAVSTPSPGVEERVWSSGCEAAVTLDRVEGGGHTWRLLPSTTARLFDFFEAN